MAEADPKQVNRQDHLRATDAKNRYDDEENVTGRLSEKVTVKEREGPRMQGSVGGATDERNDQEEAQRLGPAWCRSRTESKLLGLRHTSVGGDEVAMVTR